jgi:superfamily I DNA and RNA helicase
MTDKSIMEFVSSQNFDSDAEKGFWEALKIQLKDELGVAWHRHPITNRRGNQLEPDFTIIGRMFGLCVIETKGMKIEDIEDITGYTWLMNSKYYRTSESPIEQVRHHRFAISDRLRDSRGGLLQNEEGNCKIPARHFVALPYITEAQWDSRFYNSNVSKDNLIFKSDIESQRLKEIIVKEKNIMTSLTNEEWEVVLGVLTTGDALSKGNIRKTKGDATLSHILRKVEDKIAYLDIEQHKIAIQIPDGPQRIRGLAGTGKTVILAMKVAQMHIRNPNWRIAITYYTRSLAVQIKNYIVKFFRHMLSDETVNPDWEKIDILNGWGSLRAKDGLYAIACIATDTQLFRNFKNATDFYSTSNGSIALDKCCQELLMLENIPQIYDSILIDEAQDFKPYFFRLCREMLKEPKRLIWGYDDLQTLDDVEIPTVDKIFGLDKNNNSIVDLSGTYPGDIEKDMVLYHCYRNPRPVIIAAHAFGLGLFRKKGAVQFIESAEGWRDIGYEVSDAESGILPVGNLIRISRPQANSPHLLETLYSYDKIVRHQLFNSRQDEIEWICNDIARNINVEGLNPEDIIIISLDSRQKHFSSEFTLFSRLLAALDIEVVSGSEDRDSFTQKDKVLITSIFRAKGNEAPVVYVYGFERVNGAEQEVLQNRNRAFTAMTRAKGWLVITGCGEEAAVFFEEIKHALSEIGSLTFYVPDKHQIRRNLETHEHIRRRKQKDQAQKSARQLIRDLKDVDPRELSSEDRRLLIKLLTGDSESDSG